MVVRGYSAIVGRRALVRPAKRILDYALGVLVVALVFAIARDHLATTTWATLNVTNRPDVELALQNATVMARLTVGTPIVRLIAVANAGKRPTTD
jgi:hypothetical protein